MPNPDELGHKILELEEEVRILQLENDHLADRAEDTLLLGLIAEQISTAEEIEQVLEYGLERISVLKDVPFCACCLLTGNRATMVKSYLSFSDEDVNNRTIVFPETVLLKLAAGDCLLSRDECSNAGISVELKTGSFVPLSAICIPLRTRYTGANIFFFADDKSEERLSGFADMLHRVTEMMSSRIDNISLFQELHALNSGLDRKVEERTRELQESENRFRQFFENEPAYCYMISPDGLILDVNKSALDVLGYGKEDIVGRPLQTIYAPESLPKMMKNFEKWRTTGKLKDVETVILSKSGEKRTVLLSTDAVKDVEGNLIHSISVQQDITERKQAEEERLAHLRFFESMDGINRAIQGANDLEQMMSDVLDASLSVFECDSAWLVYPCDPTTTACRVPMERSRPEYAGTSAVGHGVPVVPEIAQLLQTLCVSGGPVKFGPGSEHPLPPDMAKRFNIQSQIVMAIHPKTDKPYAFGLHQCSCPRIWTSEEERLFQEIGRRLADGLSALVAYGNLRDSLEKLEEAQRIAHIGYWDRDIVGNRVTLAGEACRIFGIAADDCVFNLEPWHQRWLTLVHPEDLHRVNQAYVEALGSGPCFNVEYRIVRPDGEVRHVHSEANVTRDEAGHAIRMLGMIQEITERKKAQDSLDRANREWERTFNAISDHIMILDNQHKILRANRAMAGALGMTVQELIGKSCFELVHGMKDPPPFCPYSQLLADGEEHSAEVVEPRLGGIYDVRVSPLIDQNGQVIGSVHVTRDITERKRTENIMMSRVRLMEYATSHSLDELLQATLDEVEVLTDSSIGFYHFVEPDQRTLWLQAWSTRTLGEMCTAEGRGLHYDIDRAGVWGDCVHERKPVIHNDYSALPHRKGMPPGHAHVIRELVVPVFRDDRIVAVLGVGNKPVDYGASDIETVSLLADLAWDIAERKKAEEAVHEAQQVFRTLVENSPDIIARYDRECRRTYVNPTYLKVAQISRQELLASTPIQRSPLPAASAAVLQNLLRRVLDRGVAEAVDVIWPMPDNTDHWYNVHAVPEFDREGRVVNVITVSRNITDRKRAERELQKSNDLLRAIIEAAPTAIAGLDLDGNVQGVWNPAAEKMLGWSAQEVMGRLLPSVLAKSQEEFRRFREHIRSGKTLDGVEVRRQRRDGTPIDYSIYASPLYDAEGGITGNVCVLVDVTHRTQAEAALRESEEKYRTLFEESIDGVYSVLRSGEITVANPSFLEILGYTNEGLVGKDVRELYVDPTDRQRFQKEIEKKGFVKDYEIKLRKRDGTALDCQITTSVYLKSDGSTAGYRGILRDVTDRKLLERQLLQAQKMESIGTLAGGIAHDFNNLLQVVLGYSDMLLFHKKPTDREYEGLHAIRQAGRDASELASRILAFSRRLEPNARPLNLNNEIVRVQKMLKRTVPKMIQVELVLADDLMTVNADPGQMEQMLLNLAVNAQHAMPDGGRLTIETANVTLNEDYCRTHLGAEPGKHVLMIVSDTGHGMDKEVVEHIFEPFYTTKGPGEGTGLGLAMVYGIVKSHGGRITCYSEPGAGTTFKIYLPAVVQVIEPDVDVSRQMPAFGTETILLVDDEDRIRKLGEQILTMAGYQVLTATNGRDALEVYRSNRRRIALVLLDLIMPEMGGKQCLEELLKINPRVKVIISSGYALNGPTKESVEAGAKGFISKPYDSKELLTAVRKYLDESP